MVNSRQKGARGELLVQNMLIRHTGLDFALTPGSGSGKIKGDLYLEHKHNIFLIEVKFYKEVRKEIPIYYVPIDVRDRDRRDSWQQTACQLL